MSYEHYSESLSPIETVIKIVNEAQSALIKSEIDYSEVELDITSNELDLKNALKIKYKENLKSYCSILTTLQLSDADVEINPESDTQMDYMLLSSQLKQTTEAAILFIISEIEKNSLDELEAKQILSNLGLSHLLD